MCGVKIDKSTGRGCAWGIASKTIVRRLVDEGIIGKEICKNRHPSPICTRFEHHFHVLKPHLHRRSFSDTLPENQRHLIALKRHPLWHMQKFCNRQTSGRIKKAATSAARL